MTKQAQKARWGLAATKSLKGKVVKSVRYMSEKEREEYGWYNCAAIVVFEDGSWLMPSTDDEGNDAGALFSSDPDLDTIPVI